MRKKICRRKYKMILDKLLEKKDILAYIDSRLKQLKINKRESLKGARPKLREAIVFKFEGREEELRELKKVVNAHDLKKMSKVYWEKAYKSGLQDLEL